jgi:hypothetical protein
MPWRRAAAGARPATLFGPPERRLLLLQAMWPHVVGAAVARKSAPASLRRDVLVVRVVDARWRRALHRMQRDIIVKMRERIGPSLAPARLGFLEGPVEPGPAAETWKPPEPAAPPEDVAAAAEAIDDPELRAMFLRTAGRYLQTSRARVRREGDDDA